MERESGTTNYKHCTYLRLKFAAEDAFEFAVGDLILLVAPSLTVLKVVDYPLEQFLIAVTYLLLIPHYTHQHTPVYCVLPLLKTSTQC